MLHLLLYVLAIALTLTACAPGSSARCTRLAPDGTVRVETRGFPGRSCLEASRLLAAALARTVGDRLTSEFYLPQTAEVQPRLDAY